MVEKLFRNEVIEAGRNRLTGRVVIAAPPNGWLYTKLALAAASVAILILFFGNYATSANVRGMVAYDRGVTRIYPRAPAEVARVLVRTGQRVEAGEPLVELRLEQGPGGVAPQLSDLARQDTELARQVALTQIDTSSQLSALTQRDAGLGTAIASLERQLVLAREQVRIAESAAKRAAKLAAEQAATQRQVEDARSLLLARRAEAEAIEEQVAAQRNAQRTNAAERARLEANGLMSASVINGQRAALAAEIKALARSNQIVLVAPVAGIVGDVMRDIGQSVTSSTAVATIIPADSKLEVWLYAPTRAVGHARTGQRVRLQFHRKYGTGTGVIGDVARVPTEAASLDPGLKIDEPVFRIRARIAEFAPRADKAPDSLRPGMTLTGKILVEERSLWTVLFGSFGDGAG
jgi:membrane fusion protein